jgi:hypothetical protein
MRPRLIRPSRDGTGHPEIDRGVAGRSLCSDSIRPVLCFIDAEWPLLGGPKEFKGVLIESDRSLRRRIAEAGELDAEGVRQVAMVLAHRFPACT